jgi:hypothetical protein
MTFPGSKFTAISYGQSPWSELPGALDDGENASFEIVALFPEKHDSRGK